MNLGTVSDITPDGAAKAIGTAGVWAVWVLVHSATGNGADIRVGDVNVGSARGVSIPAGQSLLLPRVDFAQGGYDLGATYVYGASGSDSCSITFGA